MSTLERTIAIIFEGDDKTQAAFSSVGANLSNFKGSVEDAAAKLAGIADNVLKLDAALLAMAAGGLAYSVAKAGEFNQATSEIGTLVTDTAFNMGEYRNAILDYAQSSTQSIGDITASLYTAISAGQSWENSIKAVAVAEQLAVAGKADLNDTTRLLLSTLNAYGAGIDDATRYSDVFFQTVKYGQTTVPELAASLSQVTGIAAAAGIPIETLSAALALATSKGDSTSIAVTGLRAAIQAIIKPTTDAEKVAALLGIEFNAGAIASKGFEGVLLDVWKATGGNVEVIARLFTSVEGLKFVMQTFGQDGGQAFLNMIEKMQGAAGATAVAYTKMVNEMENINQRLINSMKTTFIKVGQPLLDDYAGLMNALAEIFKGLNVGIDEGAFNEVFRFLEEVAGQLASYIDGIAKALPAALQEVDFKGFTAALEDLVGAVSSYLDGLDLTKPEDLAKAIQYAVDLMTGLVNVTTGMVDAFRPFAQQIADFFIELAKGDPQLQKSAGEILAYAKVITSLGLEVALALKAMQTSGTEWADALDIAIAGARLAWETFVNFLANAALGIVTLVQGITTALDILFGGFTPAFGEASAQLDQWRIALNTAVTEGAQKWLGSAADMVQALGGLNRDLETVEGRMAATGVSTQQLASYTSAATDKLRELGLSLKDIPSNVDIRLFLQNADSVTWALENLGYKLEDIPKEWLIELIIADLQGKEEFARVLQDYVESLQYTEVAIKARLDQEETRKIEAELETLTSETRWLNFKIDFNQAEYNSLISELESFASETRYVDLYMNMDKASVDEAKKTTEELTKTRVAEIEWYTKLEIAKVEADAEVAVAKLELMGESIKWNIELEIAEVQAMAAMTSAAFGALASSFDSSGQVMSSAIDAYASMEDTVFDLTGKRSFIEDIIRSEMALRSQAMDLTAALIYTQIEYMNAKIGQMQRGEALIQVDGAGLQPHLEAFMWEILQQIQIRVNEEGHAMLFGT
jgi:TP901 family phage tail tape measure protein